MKILSNAIYEFKIQNYSKAIELFREAGHLYGENVVSAHIALCLKHTPQDLPTAPPLPA